MTLEENGGERTRRSGRQNEIDQIVSSVNLWQVANRILHG